VTFSNYPSVRGVVQTTLLLAGLSLATSPELLAEDGPAEDPQSSEQEPAQDPPEEAPTEPLPPTGDSDWEEIPAPSLPADEFKGFRLGGCVGWELACLLGQIRLGHSNERYGWLVTLPLLDVEIIKYFNRNRNQLDESSPYNRGFVSLDYSVFCSALVAGEELYWHLACFEPGVGIEFRPDNLRRLIFRPRVSVGLLMFDQEFGLPLPTGSLSILWAP